MSILSDRSGGLYDDTGAGQTSDRSAGIDAGGGSSLPVITGIEPGETTAVVTYTGAASVWRVDGGASSALGNSPATISGLMVGEEYDAPGLEISADGISWSLPMEFGTDNPASGGGSLTTPPLLSNATVIDITSTSARPRVTITF
jgi:hypothetical protein